MRYVFLLCLFLVGPGCAISANQEEEPVIISWSAELSKGAPYWYLEAKKRFTSPVIFQCHGDSSLGVWYLFPDPPRPIVPVESVASLLSQAFPRRTIVLVVCNSAGQTLHLRNVYYPKGITRATPNSYLSKSYDNNTIWDYVND